MSEKADPTPPDLKSLLREASPPVSEVTVPLKQGLAKQIREAEAELVAVAADPPKGKRAASASPVRDAAQRVEELRAEMAASALTFHFRAIGEDGRDEVRKAMQGRDDADESNLRVIAAMCTKVTTADGTEFVGEMTWEDFRDLRTQLGVRVFEETIDEAATEASGARGWSVPFSSAASHILATAK